MTADLIIKNANVFMTYRQCFEKRDVAVAGEIYDPGAYRHPHAH